MERSHELCDYGSRLYPCSVNHSRCPLDTPPQRKKWPIEVSGLLERALDAGGGGDSTVNVEYRDASGTSIDLTPYIKGSLRNGHGRAFNLKESVFELCDPHAIRAGVMVQISLQEGLVKESLRVQLDYEKQILFVQSKKAKTELVDIINGGSKNNESDNNP